MRHMLSIDFGSAYTKVGVRRSLNQPSQLITEESLVLDPEHFCIPTLAAVAERGGKTRWVYGPDAVKVVEGNGIRVYRNWKSQLFTASSPLQVVGQRSSEKTFGPPAGPPVLAGEPTTTGPPGDTDPEIKEVTLKYFTWLRKFLTEPCQRLGVKDLGIVPVRLCVPAFGTNGRVANNYSPSEEMLLEILTEAGWSPDDECPIVTEPKSNAIGIYTKGKNKTWRPNGPRGKEYIHFQQMFDFGGYLTALRRRSLQGGESPNYCVLVIDIGAFTTDLAVLDFDLDHEDKPPTVICESQPLGVQELDQDVLRHLPKPNAARVAALDARRREELKQAIYVAEMPYRLEGSTTIGMGSEARTIRQCVLDLAGRVRDSVEHFLRKQQVTKLQEAILTGGGNLIPRLCSSLIDALVNTELHTPLSIHSPLNGQTGPNPRYYHNELDSRLVRGSSGIGGASVYFERRFW